MPLAMEVVDQPLFDTVHTLHPRTVFRSLERAFTIPVGSTVLTNEGHRIKDFVDTNLFSSGMLDGHQAFVIKAIRCAFIGKRILPVSSRFYADTLLRLVVNRKTYWTCPAWKCADPVTMVVNPDALLTMGKHKLVDLIRSLRRTLSPRVTINTQELFSMDVEFTGTSWREPSDDAAQRFVILLEGQFLRPTI